MGSERRGSRRFDADVLCFYAPDHALETSRGRLLDISRQGARLLGASRLTEGQTIRVRIANYDMRLVRGTVIRVEESAEGWELGVSLDENAWPSEVFSEIIDC